MKKGVLLLIPFILLLIAAIFKNQNGVSKKVPKECSHQQSHLHLNRNKNGVELFEDYVVSVIKHGSGSLGFATKMEGGYVSEEDAKKIAAYLATLQGYKPTHPEFVKEGAALYYGNCVGCHQKGVKSFPDLTRKPLLGIEKMANKR